MKAVIAIDSFKGSLDTFESGAAVAEGITRVFSNAEIKIYPLADGGEGTVRAVTTAKGGEFIRVSVTGPLGNRVLAEYGIIESESTAVIEMSAAAGITLVPEDKRSPLYTTTRGVGELILDALDRGCRRFILGIGGSATNDGGVGMLKSLGFEFFDSDGKEISDGAAGLSHLCKIRDDNVDKRLSECEISVACDVSNPLCGVLGCSRVYGPQKGADEKMIDEMDLWMSRYAELTKTLLPAADADFPGVGAAGGMGFALKYYLGARLTSGIGLVMEAIGLEEGLRDADIVVTGEGRLDSQSAMGKAPVGVARLAKKYGRTVIAFAGAVTDDASTLNDCGIDAFFPIIRRPCTLSEAMNKENARKNLADTAEQVFRLIKI